MSTDALNESVTGAVSLGSAASEHNSPEGEGVASGNNLNSGGPTDSSMSRKKSSVTSALKTAAGRSLSTSKVYYCFIIGACIWDYRAVLRGYICQLPVNNDNGGLSRHKLMLNCFI
jgi:hypothetical protein